MQRMYKNWTVHNLLGHPIAQIAYMLAWCFVGADRARDISARVHDMTVPE